MGFGGENLVAIAEIGGGGGGGHGHGHSHNPYDTDAMNFPRFQVSE